MHTAHQRLAILAEASGALFSSLALHDILPAVGTLAKQLFPADGFAVWRLDASALTWHAVWHEQVPPDLVTSLAGRRDDGTLLPAPLLLTDTSGEALLGGRMAHYAAAGIHSVAIIPLRMHDRTHGTVAVYYKSPKIFSETDRMVATALSNLGSSALRTAVLYEAEARSRYDAELAERRAAFLADAGAALAGSLDYEETLRRVVHLAVPETADWAAVDIVDRAGELRRLAVAHVDPEKIDLVETIDREYPRDPEAPAGVHAVVRTRQPILLEEIPPALLEAAARDARHLELIRRLGLHSYMCVPLVAHGRALGALTFATADASRRFTPADLRLAQDLAARVALAVENARAYDEASRANRLKDEFLATLSHELRTPLNAVLGYTRMLRTGAVPADKHGAALETIERNASALTQLVEDVLDVSGIEAGKIRLQLQPVNVAGVISAALETVAPAAEGRAVRLVTRIDPDVPVLSADPDRLQQVVWNLLSNAVKFTPPEGTVAVELSQGEGQARIVVRDTGIGVPPDFLPYMFERFRQADSRFSREHGGLGLGLAITRHLVEMHGGTIVAESDGLGHGTAFTIRLPLRVAGKDAGTPSARAASSGSPEAADLPALGGIHVLAVDDDPDALMLLREVLVTAGARVTTAESAQRALEWLAGATPDAIVADLDMPGMDGIAFIEALRGSTDAHRQSIPAAALVSHALSADRARALEHGFQVHLAKPISPAALANAIRALVDEAPAAQR